MIRRQPSQRESCEYLGTINHKYDPPRKVTVETCEPERRYNPGDFDWLPVTVEEPGATRAELDLSTPVPVGSRNATLYRVGRSLRAQKVPPLAIASTLRAMNHNSTVFEKPLPDPEVEKIVDNVMGQPNRREFDDDPRHRDPSAEAGGEQPVITQLSKVTRERVSWLWDRRIASGKLNIIAGEPGEGKSTLTMDMAARVTTGTAWPDGSFAPSGDVLLLSAEDGLGDTIAPRLDDAGADESRVHALTAVRSTDGRDRHLDLSRDLPKLEIAVQKVKPIVVIIDPLSAYLGRTYSWKDSEVRSLLSPLAAMAESYRYAVVGVMHLSKNSGRKALHRLIGSIGFSAAARVVMAVAVDPEDDTRRLLLPVKNNLSPKADTLAFRIIDRSVDWEPGVVEGLTADSVLNELPADQMDRQDADDFLREMLAGGELVLSKIIYAGAKANGISERTIRRAKSRLGVRTKLVGFGKQGRWHMWMPSSEGQEPQSQPAEMAISPETATHEVAVSDTLTASGVTEVAKRRPPSGWTPL